ncbi:acyltransferase family protein [Aquipseudomonas guryensis]|uniref:acyltransferase family protein n=1 Tax=Aquipseudomonas guryensis TaxID=2759165 RepID=UPI002E2AE96B|nr:acyltransferase [Pseudomonas guryensis]
MKVAGRLRPLDGLRGVAILLVIFYHAWDQLGVMPELPESLFPLSFLWAGNTGVTLFFLLSGFLVSRPFFEGLQRGELPSFSKYALQRALRILPPYYVVGLFGLLYTQQYDQWSSVLLIRATGYDLGYFSTVWWSLATEVQFYLLVPFLFLTLCNLQRRKAMLLLCGVGLALYLLVISKWAAGRIGFELQYRLILSVIGQMPAFLVGMLLVLLLKHGHRRLSVSMSTLILSVLLLLLAWVLSPAAAMQPQNYIWHAPWYVLPEALLWGGITWVMLARKQPSFSLLDNRLTRFFGKISFSLYLVHMPIIQVLQEHAGFYASWLAAILAVLLSIALAQVLYWLIEKPSLLLKDKLTQPQILQGIKT